MKAFVITGIAVILLLSACKELKKETNDIINFFSRGDKSALVEGISLKYTAVDTLQADYNLAEFSVNESSADVSLSGSDDAKAYLVVTYLEYAPGDATVQIQGSSLVITTKSGKPALISNIAGKLPKQTGLKLNSTSGDLQASMFSGSKLLKLHSVSGNIDIRSCSATEVNAETVSGNISAAELIDVDTILMDCTSGDITLRGSKANKLTADTISGDISVTDSNIGYMLGNSVSGDIQMISSSIPKRKLSTTSGEVTEE